MDDIKGSEHFDYIKMYVLRDMEKVLEIYNKLISENMVGNNVEVLDYNL